MELFTERHADKISGELSCLDRVVITGTIPSICHAEAMSAYLRFKSIRIFDYARWAEPLRIRFGKTPNGCGRSRVKHRAPAP